jgi:uncharacterized membrane protein
MNNDAQPFFPGRRGFAPMVLDHHSGPGTLGWVIFALQLLMLAALAVLLVRAFTWRPALRRTTTSSTSGGTNADPVDHLRWRYARGEISREEYLQTSRDLGGEPDAPTEELPAS